MNSGSWKSNLSQSFKGPFMLRYNKVCNVLPLAWCIEHQGYLGSHYSRLTWAIRQQQAEESAFDVFNSTETIWEFTFDEGMNMLT